MEHPAEALIRSLGLAPHPEGGFYREIWRAAESVEPADRRGARAGLTSIYFLLPAGAVSRWHRVRSDELWHHLAGAPLELLRAPPDGARLERLRLGPLGDAEEALAPPIPGPQAPVHGVAAGWWQAARSLGAYTLVACSVGPGFDFADFALLAGSGDPAESRLRGRPEAALLF